MNKNTQDEAMRVVKNLLQRKKYSPEEAIEVLRLAVKEVSRQVDMRSFILKNFLPFVTEVIFGTNPRLPDMLKEDSERRRQVYKPGL